MSKPYKDYFANISSPCGMLRQPFMLRMGMDKCGDGPITTSLMPRNEHLEHEWIPVANNRSLIGYDLCC